jgi:CubicO group peptidase (beta-lactamase class C family)
MLLGGVGAVDGAPGLVPRDAALHDRATHLPGGGTRGDARAVLQFAEATYDGVGFGLGFSVSVDPVATKVTTTVGEHAWGGLASTAFWVDPAEELAVHFFTQLVPSSTYPLRTELRQLVYGRADRLTAAGEAALPLRRGWERAQRLPQTGGPP